MTGGNPAAPFSLRRESRLSQYPEAVRIAKGGPGRVFACVLFIAMLRSYPFLHALVRVSARARTVQTSVSNR